MAPCTPVSFDLVVFTPDAGASSADIRAAHEQCRRGEHTSGAPQAQITSFYRAITADYPDHPGAAGSPWQVSPLHVATDHIEMRLLETCADEVLLTIERLAAEHGLVLFDPQDGSVYPPPAVPSTPPPPPTPPAAQGPVARGSAPVVRASAPVARPSAPVARGSAPVPSTNTRAAR